MNLDGLNTCILEWKTKEKSSMSLWLCQTNADYSHLSFQRKFSEEDTFQII